MSARTPGPWHVNAIDSKRKRIVGDETAEPGTFDKLTINNHNCTVATVYRAADARFIADAGTRSDDTLRAEVARLREALTDLLKYSPTWGALASYMPHSHDYVDRYKDAREQARSALATKAGE